ncbi:hypothetical protein [Methanobrevibacter sp.]|uniref:hypothetical protein n=1 Tax=Methanobrevibacter sp. TaxID=66852 RepID=UPI0025F7D052|nr:hypothetical protein [Methanobrevibacter sp.]MBQ2831301.1 hypothetical protein [Methanobrevibacter sp.]
MSGKGLGRGLDSLIPEYYDEDFDSNSTQSLEDLLNEKEETDSEISTPVEEEKSSEEGKNIFEEIEEEIESTSSDDEEIIEEVEEEAASEEEDSDIPIEDETTPKIQADPAHIEEVTQIVDKNPRITLWSSRSAAVLRYLRKTEPEFSISKEASTLIDEAVSKKYPEIWELFNQY